jgi:hypothetical protein
VAEEQPVVWADTGARRAGGQRRGDVCHVRRAPASGRHTAPAGCSAAPWPTQPGDRQPWGWQAWQRVSCPLGAMACGCGTGVERCASPPSLQLLQVLSRLGRPALGGVLPRWGGGGQPARAPGRPPLGCCRGPQRMGLPGVRGHAAAHAWRPHLAPPHPPPPPSHSHVYCIAADEHYIPTLLSVRGLENETYCGGYGLAATNWTWGGPHPRAWRSREIKPWLMESLRMTGSASKMAQCNNGSTVVEGGRC